MNQYHYAQHIQLQAYVWNLLSMVAQSHKQNASVFILEFLLFCERHYSKTQIHIYLKGIMIQHIKFVM